MTQAHPLNQAVARECLQHLGEEKSVLFRAAHVLEVVAHSSVGLGEVLQDYAHQAWGQLHEVIRAARNISGGVQTNDDLDALRNINLIMKGVRTVLERTPAAMTANKAETLGDKEKTTAAQVQEVAHAFAHSPDILRITGADDSGQTLVNLLAATEEAALLPEQQVLPGASANH